MERFRLHQLIEDNIQLFQTIAANKKISLGHNTPETLVINSDRNILHLVLRNLLSNAIKFSFEGGTITIHVDVTDSMLLIQVKDQGVGMDEDAIQSLVAPDSMVSTTGTRNEKGTGMGLALCREYLQKAGGHLSIESEKGKGSTFNMLFPLD
jgi:signal transduction histidine kinase